MKMERGAKIAENKDRKMCIKCFNFIEGEHSELSMASGIEKEVSYICMNCYRELTAPTITITTDSENGDQKT